MKWPGPGHPRMNSRGVQALPHSRSEFSAMTEEVIGRGPTHQPLELTAAQPPGLTRYVWTSRSISVSNLGSARCREASSSYHATISRAPCSNGTVAT